MAGTVIQVGDGGRGFIIATEEARYVVTAAHCLSDLPPAHAASYTHERLCAHFIGALDGPRNVWAECVFVDPVADLAVFCEPDNQQFPDEAQDYCRLTESATPFALRKLGFRRQRHRLPDGQIMSGPRKAVSEALMLSLDGEWFSCWITSAGRALWIEDAAQPIRSGMSGSPIILPDGSAIGVMCVSTEREGGPNPALFASLPAWLVREAL
jgi:hypothetical protein